MCKEHAAAMNRLLIYSLITKEMWTSIIPWFGKRSKTCNIFGFCLLWSIWRERKQCHFEGLEGLVYSLSVLSC